MSDLQDTLLEEFRQIQGAISDSTEAWNVGGGRGEVQADTAPRGTVDARGDQTGVIDRGGGSSSSGSGSSSSPLGGIGGALAAGLGIVPLGLEIASLFDGGESAPPTLTNYAMPDRIDFTGSTGGSGPLSDADFGQSGQPRPYGAPGQPASAGQPIQITVQALDAQSILDRSDDIASAVNKALLSLHPIADTISNL